MGVEPVSPFPLPRPFSESRGEAAEALLARLHATEEALRRCEDKLRDTQRLARVGSWWQDLVTGEGALDDELQRMYGVEPHEAPRSLDDFLALVHPEDRDHVRSTLSRAVNDGEAYTMHFRIQRHGITLRHIHARGRVECDAHGRPIRVVGSAQDVTEQRETQIALARSEEHFRRLIENSSDYVMIVDRHGAITYVGPSVVHMLGYEPHEMIGQGPTELVHPDDLPQVFEAIAYHLAHPGGTTVISYRIRHKDGSWRHIENVGRTLSPHTADDGLVANCRDITARREAEEALARAKEQAEQANRAKSEFLGRMSHELRTPMNSILGFAQLLARTELPAPHAKGVQHILKAGRHLLHLINEVLEISRIEAGRERFSVEPVALVPVVQEAVGLVRPLAQQFGVHVHELSGPSSAFVHADRQRLVQVLLNLLSNAIKYNRDGGEVSLSVAPDGTDRWIVRVQDSGRGIPSDRVNELFTPFARLGAEQTDVEGTGLGLALSKRLCEAMGGGLELEQSSSSGSIFRLALTTAESPLRVLQDTGAHPVPHAPHRDATLLYVEDNLANLSLVETILLARPGWRTISALQGQLGVELAREHHPDLILLDLHLPDISGQEVLRRLRSDARTAAIPVVVVSADATASSVDRLREAGADAYLTKPLDVDEFVAVLDRFLPED